MASQEYSNLRCTIAIPVTHYQGPVCGHLIKNLSCIHIVPFLFLPSATRLPPVSEIILILYRNLRIFRATEQSSKVQFLTGEMKIW
jgi:hypothetical protein